ncbi:type II secretion system protein G precursor [Peptococcaceae bacterium CEB3]|nr:type II secretion system protein G precursor [Peptococcaceae bacterium CEB3]
MKRRKRKDDGFTLIELMIVIAVIGILAVVLVPRFAGVKTSAKLVGVTTNVHELDVYITSQIGNWNAQAAASQGGGSAQNGDALAAAAISTNYGTTVTNPINGSTTILSLLSGGTDPGTDAVVISDSAPDPSVTRTGEVFVTLNMDPTNQYLIDSVNIQGYDNSGSTYGSQVTVTP